MALKRAYRLPAGIRLINPRTYKTRAFLLKVAANNISRRRFGFIVPKTIDKRAVVRNKIRRMFQTCVRSMIEKVGPGHDMLFVAQREAKETNKEEISIEIQKILTLYV